MSENINLKLVVIPLAIISVITSFAAVNLPDDKLHVSFLNVGQGDAALIQSGGTNILIDGGPSPRNICLELSSRLPFWDRDIDLVILTHPHLDHLAGIVEVLKRYRVKQVIAPNIVSDSQEFTEFIELIKSRSIRFTLAEHGQIISIDGATTIEIFNPVDINATASNDDIESRSIVLKVQRGDISFLFTSDIDQQAELDLISRRVDLKCSVLKVAHHGSNTSSSTQFLSMAHPQIAVISAGSDNPFGHPDPAVLARLTSMLGSNEHILRTDLDGTIIITTNGHDIWIKSIISSY